MSEEKLQMWKASLAKDPILLRTEMSLMPISEVVAIIDEEKGDACYEALCNLFGIKDFGVFAREEERASQAEKENEEKSRRDSNTRAGSVKPLDVFKELIEFILPPHKVTFSLTAELLRKLLYKVGMIEFSDDEGDD